MKFLFLGFIFTLNLSMAFADTCTEKHDEIYKTKADKIAFMSLVNYYELLVAEKEEMNDSFFGDFLVSDNELRLYKMALEQSKKRLDIRTRLVDSSIAIYTSCMLLEYREHLSDIDVELGLNLSLLNSMVNTKRNEYLSQIN